MIKTNPLVRRAHSVAARETIDSMLVEHELEEPRLRAMISLPWVQQVEQFLRRLEIPVPTIGLILKGFTPYISFTERILVGIALTHGARDSWNRCGRKSASWLTAKMKFCPGTTSCPLAL